MATKKKPAKKEIKPVMSDEEVKKFALDLVQNRYFMSDQIANPRDVAMVFMPLMFMEKKDIENLKDNEAVLYEEVRKAGPRSVNGMPMFTSFGWMNSTDHKRVIEVEKKLREAMKAVKV